MGGSLSSSGSSSSTGKKRKAPGGTISSVDRATLDLKNARDRLSRYKKKLEQDESKLVARARKAKQEGQQKTALNLLRLRKIKKIEVENVEGQLLNVLQMVQTIDSKQNEAEVLAAMAKGKDTLQKMHEETSMDDVLDLMDQIQEQNEIEREISSILQDVPNLSMADEEAVEAELAALMMQDSINLPTVPDSTLLPIAPNSKLPEQAGQEAEKRVAVAS